MGNRPLKVWCPTCFSMEYVEEKIVNDGVLFCVKCSDVIGAYDEDDEDTKKSQDYEDKISRQNAGCRLVLNAVQNVTHYCDGNIPQLSGLICMLCGYDSSGDAERGRCLRVSK